MAQRLTAWLVDSGPAFIAMLAAYALGALLARFAPASQA